MIIWMYATNYSHLIYWYLWRMLNLSRNVAIRIRSENGETKSRTTHSDLLSGWCVCTDLRSWDLVSSNYGWHGGPDFSQVIAAHKLSTPSPDGAGTRWLKRSPWPLCPLSSATGLGRSFTPPYPLPSPTAALTSHPGFLWPLSPPSPPSLPPAGWRKRPVAVENGCHDNGAQLYPFAVGENVSRPPPAGPHHADEGQHLCPRQLGVPAGNRHLPHTVTTCSTVTVHAERPRCVMTAAPLPRKCAVVFKWLPIESFNVTAICRAIMTVL